MTAAELRQRVAVLVSREEGNTDPAKYWQAILPKSWRGPYPRHWCGAMALWALHVELGCDWLWAFGPPNYGFLFRLPRAAKPDLGDVAYRDKPYQHHAVVTACDIELNGRAFVITQDGNQGPSPGVCTEQWGPVDKWTAFYSIEPLIQAALGRQTPSVDVCYYCAKPLGREHDGRLQACVDVQCPGHRITVGPPYAKPGTLRD